MENILDKHLIEQDFIPIMLTCIICVLIIIITIFLVKKELKKEKK